jgi:tetratricopeptide (TPR) repeat protein
VIVSAEKSLKTPDRDDRAYALMQSALALIPKGGWREAASVLEEAAGIHAQAGRPYDEARCLQLAATLRRSAGEAGKGQTLIERAASAAPSAEPLAVSISAEQAESASAEGRYQEAVEAWTIALDKGLKVGLKPEGISALLRRRAAALMALDKMQQAKVDFDRACQVLESADAQQMARFVRIEQAELLWRYGQLDETEHAVARLEADLASTEATPQLLAEVLVMRARLARAGGKTLEALDYAHRSRDAALQATAPVSYFAASVELAESFQSRGNYADAYGTLATAWATLSDLLGDDTARSWIEPCLLAYQIAWGEARFQNAKSKYEGRRRAELKRKA